MQGIATCTVPKEKIVAVETTAAKIVKNPLLIGLVWSIIHGFVWAALRASLFFEKTKVDYCIMPTAHRVSVSPVGVSAHHAAQMRSGVGRGKGWKVCNGQAVAPWRVSARHSCFNSAFNLPNNGSLGFRLAVRAIYFSNLML